MIKFIVEKYQAVFVFAIMVIILGMMAYSTLPRESAPEIRRPMIFITTIYPGVSAVDIESLVTKEIEDELDGLTGLDKITSSSSLGVSSITAEFTGDTEVEIALRRVRERVDTAKADIPEDAEEPFIKELNFSDQPIFIVNVSNPNGIEVLEDTTVLLEDEFKKIPGVLDVRVSGKLEKEVQINLDPARLKHYGFSTDDIMNAIRNENITIPGGVLKNKVQQYSLAVSGEIKKAKLFGEIVVNAHGKQVKLKELGDVVFAYKEPDTINRMDGKPAISLAVTKRSGENLIRIVDDIKKSIEDNKERFPFGTVYTYSFDQSKDIKNMVADLENNIISGLILVLVVTLFFLGPINATFVSLGIPFSMLISFFVLNMFGITLNMVVLFSLVLALGMLVDNGIVIVENIYRHRSMGKGPVESAIDGTQEVFWPITSSTLTTVLAFLPIIFMPDIMGEFMSYIPKTVIIVLVSSLVVGVTITTVFCSRFLKVDEKAMQAMTSGNSGFQKVQKVYERSLRFALKRPFLVIGASFLFVFLGIILNGALGKETIFFPSFDPNVAVVNVTTPSGTPLTTTDDITKELEALAPTVPNSIDNIQATTGKDGSQGGGRLRSNKATIRIGFKPYLDRTVGGKDYIESLKKKVEGYAGAEIKVQEQQEGPPSGHDLSFEVIGDDYAVMGDLADQLISFMEVHKESLRDIDSDFEAVKPELDVIIDREKAAMYGLNTRLIASSIRTAMNGSIVSKFREGKDEYDVVVRFEEQFRNRLHSLNELEIVKDGKRIPLDAIASVGHKSSVEVIKRKDRRRTVAVWGDFKENISGKEEIKKDLEQKVAGLQLPPGYRIGHGEGQDMRDRAQAFLLQAFMLALLLIFMVLVLQFNSVSQPFIILISVFLSLGGVFWGLLATQMTFVVMMTGIGIISLAGVVVNNAIVLIDFINQLRREGKGVLDAVVEGGITRLRPVLLTAITTVIGLLPMALGISLDFHNFSIQWSSESSEWWAPMAWAVIYGLTFATAFTLIVVPTLLYLDFQKAEMFAKLKQKLWGRFTRPGSSKAFEA
jgi:multidrug efflux pump subunit AcrB